MSFYLQVTEKALNVLHGIESLKSSGRATLWGSSQDIADATDAVGSLRQIAVFGRIYSLHLSDGQAAVGLYSPTFEESSTETRRLKALFLRQIVRVHDLYTSIAANVPDGRAFTSSHPLIGSTLDLVMPYSSARPLLAGDTVVLNLNLTVIAYEPLHVVIFPPIVFLDG
ncbi:hypothetical protein C8R44DRAFT_866097 [Mycena epipterygia]|nr:hypothetical protein C8R44DRAFT_866097 [Mycena epipterygia]